MVRWLAILSCALAACASSPSGPQDVCSSKLPAVPGGAVQLGLGSEFSPMLDGQDVSVQLGIQGLWMFVINARVTDMDVGTDADAAAVNLQILDAAGNVVSLQTGCRDLDFLPVAGGALQLASPFTLPFQETFVPMIEGAHVTIQIDVRDRDGHEAKDQHTIIAHMPSSGSVRPLTRVLNATSP